MCMVSLIVFSNFEKLFAIFIIGILLLDIVVLVKILRKILNNTGN